MARSIYNLVDVPSFWDTETIVRAINAARDAEDRELAIEFSYDVLYRSEVEVALAGLRLAESIAEILFDEPEPDL